jgi:hypothetical protein
MKPVFTPLCGQAMLMVANAALAFANISAGRYALFCVNVLAFAVNVATAILILRGA